MTFTLFLIYNPSFLKVTLEPFQAIEDIAFILGIPFEQPSSSSSSQLSRQGGSRTSVLLDKDMEIRGAF